MDIRDQKDQGQESRELSSLSSLSSFGSRVIACCGLNHRLQRLWHNTTNFRDCVKTHRS